MQTPGIINLGDVALTAINAATTATVVTSNGYINNRDGMLSASLKMNFAYGSGGTSIKATVETSLDQGLTWVEVARFAITTVSIEKVVNLSGLTPLTTLYAPVALSDDTVKDGIFGERWRAKIITVGTYAGNTSLSIRMIAR
jgi:hypothetical protein